ncbi:MAG TPA: copper chaperone PCu(A)C [Streptosporangiaceae bacterium]|nr:copper chaperone PCu(A)C [Streptosporangiaceae bacterium]
MTATAATGARQRARTSELARAAAAPLVCGVILIALLAGWVAGGGGGTLSRLRIQVTRATVPMVAYTARAAAGKNAGVYITIRNLARVPDVLLSASSPAAAQVVITRAVTQHPAIAVGGLVVPAGGTISLSPLGADLVLIRPHSLMSGQTVLLRLRFKNAGELSVTASVTPPGTP